MNSMGEGIMVDEATVVVMRMDIIRDSLLDIVAMLAQGIIQRRDMQGAAATTTVMEEEVAINLTDINQMKGTVSPIRVMNTDIMASRGERGSGIIANSHA